MSIDTAIQRLQLAKDADTREETSGHLHAAMAHVKKAIKEVDQVVADTIPGQLEMPPAAEVPTHQVEADGVVRTPADAAGISAAEILADKPTGGWGDAPARDQVRRERGAFDSSQLPEGEPKEAPAWE